MFERSAIIYLVRNLVNGKVYVGQSAQGLAHRKAEHLWRHKSGLRDHKLYLAFRKYGPAAFEFSVLCSVLKPEYMDDLEREFIAEFNSYNRGYNMNEGGNGVSAETKAKLSKIFKGRKAPWAKATIDRLKAEGRYAFWNHKFENKGTALGAKNHRAESYIVREPSGDQVHVTGLRAFCRANGLTHNLMFATLNGLQHNHKGYAVIAKLPKHSARLAVA